MDDIPGATPARADRPALMLLAGLVAAGAANFGFHLVAGRALAPAAYGVLGALLALLASVTVPAVALEVSITRAVAHAGPGARPLAVGSLLRRVGTLAGVAAVAITAAAAPLQHVLRLDSPVPVFLAAAYVPVLLAGLVPRGIILGRLRYPRAAAVITAGAASRLALGAVGAILFGVTGALAATLAAEAVLASGFWAAARNEVSLRAGTPLRVGWKMGGLSTAALVGFWLLASVDILLARALLPATTAGVYAAAATVAKVTLFAPLTVTNVAYPRMAAASPAAARRVLCVAAAAAAGIGLAGAAVLLASPRLVLLLFGTSYTGAGAIVGALALVTAALGVVSVVVHYHLATGNSLAVAPWLGVGVAIAAGAAWGGSPERLVIVMGAAVAATMLVAAAPLLPQRTVIRHPAPPLLTGEPALDVTVVVPFYNPGRQVRSTVERLAAELAASGVRYEIVAVADGCTDGSPLEVAALGHEHVRLIELPHNLGKGAALRVGLARGRGRYLGFIDADGDLDPAVWRPFLDLMHLYEPDVVLGSKRHPLSELHYPPLRRACSWAYQQLIRMLFRLNVRDTQTGVKLLRRDVLADVLPRLEEQRFTFDLELLVAARRLGHDRFFEAPVQLRHQRFSSTVSPHAATRMLRDTLAVFWRLHLLNRYDPTPAPSRPATQRRPVPVQTAA